MYFSKTHGRAGVAERVRSMVFRLTGTMVFGLLCSAAASDRGEVLYNGIVLPADWPPKHVKMQDFVDRKMLDEPPYLQSPPDIVPIDVGRQLFVDDFLVEQSTLKRTYHRAKYHAHNPVNSEGMAFSGGVFYDPSSRRFKMWYHGDGTRYSTSEDGLKWSKGQQVLAGSTDSQCVWLDLEEKDASKRYKMIRSVVGGGRCRGFIYFSADGLQWRHVGYTGDWGDRSTFFYNPFRRVWVLSCRHGWGVPRARRYWEVRDLEPGPYWRQEGQPPYAYFWVGSDVLDMPREELQVAPQLYNLDATPYESLMLGLFSIWRGDPRREQMPDPPTEAARQWQRLGRPKINEVCLGFSRDGWHWSRPDRRPFCPVSEDPNAWNFGNVQSAGGGCLIVGDELYFFVSGRSPTGNRTGLAILRRDGFASLDADDQPGFVTTRPVRFAGKHLFVNVETPRGELRVEVLNQHGQLIEPFSRFACVPVSADKTLVPVQWTGATDLAALAGKAVRFRFHLTRGRLYAFWVTPDSSGASHGYVAAGGPGFTGSRDTVGRAPADRL